MIGTRLLNGPFDIITKMGEEANKTILMNSFTELGSLTVDQIRDAVIVGKDSLRDPIDNDLQDLQEICQQGAGIVITSWVHQYSGNFDEMNIGETQIGGRTVKIYIPSSASANSSQNVFDVARRIVVSYESGTQVIEGVCVISGHRTRYELRNGGIYYNCQNKGICQ